MIQRCPTCGRKKTRSSEANRLYWLMIHLIADQVKPEGQQYSADTWHHYFKDRFLGSDEVRLPNGQIYKRVRSSADCDTGEFAKYLEAVQSWAAQRGVYLEDIQG